MLDENGLLWISTSPALDRRLRTRDWAGLLFDRRTLLATRVRPMVVGHGLLEKLHRPYPALTAKTLIVPVAALPEGPSGSAVDQVRLDALAAARIDRLVGASRFTPDALCPLPVAGLPGWDPANANRSYYDDTRVFRPLAA